MHIIKQIFFALALTPNFAIGATYFVTQQGNDSNTGKNWDAAWRTLQYAGERAVAGDTVIIRSGSSNYQGFTIKNSGEKNKPITFTGEDSENPPIITGATLETRWDKHDQNIWKITTTSRPTIFIEDRKPLKQASTPALHDGNWFWKHNLLYYRPTSGEPTDHKVWRTSRGGGISIKNKSWINISNIQCWLGGGSCISINNGHNNHINNIRSKWHWRGVFITNWSSHNIVENCMVEENRSGIYINGNSSYNVVDNCRSLRNGNQPLWNKSDRAGIAIGEHGKHPNNTIRNSEIAYNGGPNSDAGLIAYKAPYTIFENNHIHDNYGSGVFVTINSHHSVITNNKIERNGRKAVISGQRGVVGLTIRHGSTGTIAQNNEIINNFVSPDSRWKGKDPGPKGGLDIRALAGRDDMSNIILKNNIVSGTIGGPDIYIDKKIDLNGLIIEPSSQMPQWYKAPATNN